MFCEEFNTLLSKGRLALLLCGVGELERQQATDAPGQQTAAIVGPCQGGQGGQALHTDRDHRIKVQFHWQRNGVRHTKTRTTNNINAKGRSKSLASSFME